MDQREFKGTNNVVHRGQTQEEEDRNNKMTKVRQNITKKQEEDDKC